MFDNHLTLDVEDLKSVNDNFLHPFYSSCFLI